MHSVAHGRSRPFLSCDQLGDDRSLDLRFRRVVEDMTECNVGDIIVGNLSSPEHYSSIMIVLELGDGTEGWMKIVSMRSSVWTQARIPSLIYCEVLDIRWFRSRTRHVIRAA